MIKKVLKRLAHYVIIHFAPQTNVLATSRVVYQPIKHKNLWFIAFI